MENNLELDYIAVPPEEFITLSSMSDKVKRNELMVKVDKLSKHFPGPVSMMILKVGIENIPIDIKVKAEENLPFGVPSVIYKNKIQVEQ